MLDIGRIGWENGAVIAAHQVPAAVGETTEKPGKHKLEVNKGATFESLEKKCTKTNYPKGLSAGDAPELLLETQQGLNNILHVLLTLDQLAIFCHPCIHPLLAFPRRNGGFLN